MKYFLILSFALFTFLARAQITFQKKLYQPGGMTGYRALQSNYFPYDYWILGFLNIGVYFAKIDTSGNLKWAIRFGSSSYDYTFPRYFIESIDSCIVITGSVNGNSSYDGLLVKVNGNGNILWSKEYDGNLSTDIFNSVRETNSGDFILAGRSDMSGQMDAYLIRTDSEGNLLWTKYFGRTTGSEEIWDIIITNDGGFIITGKDITYGPKSDEVFLARTDSSGNVLWSKNYGGYGSDESRSIIGSNDSNYLIAGETSSFGSFKRSYLLKVDINGNLLWSKTYGGSYVESFTSVNQTTNGGFICAGTSVSFGGDNILLVKVDSLGNLSWAKKIGGTQHDYGKYACQTNDKGFLVTGEVDYLGPPSYTGGSIFIAKTDSIGNSCFDSIIPITVTTPLTTDTNIQVSQGTGGSVSGFSYSVYYDTNISTVCSIIVSHNLISYSPLLTIIPNPFTNSAICNVKDSKFNIQAMEIKIYNLFGKEVKPIIIRNTDSFKITRENLSPGLYFCEISLSDGHFVSGKIIILE